MATIQSFRTLRFKLPAAYMLVFAAVQLTLWIIIRLAVRGYLHQRFDAEILNQAQVIIEAIDLSEMNGRGEGSSPEEHRAALLDRVKTTLEAATADNVFASIVFPDGDIQISTANLRGIRLVDLPKEEDPSFRIETLSGPVAASLLGPGCELRVVTLYARPRVVPPYYLQVAANRDVVERTVRDLQELLTLFVLISLLVAGATSWVVAQRSLGPLIDLRDQAVRLSPERLEQRLPMPERDDEVADLARTLNGLLSRFEDQFKHQQHFISYVGHELKTPLAILLNEIQERRRGTDADPASQAFLNTIEDETRRLLRTVESFLILARGRRGRRLDIVSEVFVEDVVLAAVRNCGREALTCGVSLVPKLALEEGAPEAVVLGDADLLLRAVENLLSNAIRYSPPGGSVEIELHASLKEIDVKVRDQGPGIPAEDLDKVFGMYTQAAQTGFKSGMAGIGLALVNTVAELHGGMATARNLEAGGCELTIRLPLATGAQPAAPA